MNETVASLPFEWRLLFIGLWTQADREGRLEDRPKRLKAALFPYDDLDIDDGLGSLVNAGLITRYEHGTQRLIEIPTWAKHQRPHIHEAVSELQPHGASTLLAPTLPAMERKGTGTGKEQEGVRARFDRFWEVYPRKVAKDAALKEWLKRAPDADLTDVMIAAVHEQRASAQWLKDGGQFIPHARTWLHNERWNDEIEIGKRNKGELPRGWECPHVERCGSHFICNNNLSYGPNRFPLKPGYEQAS